MGARYSLWGQFHQNPNSEQMARDGRSRSRSARCCDILLTYFATLASIQLRPYPLEEGNDINSPVISGLKMTCFTAIIVLLALSVTSWTPCTSHRLSHASFSTGFFSQSLPIVLKSQTYQIVFSLFITRSFEDKGWKDLESGYTKDSSVVNFIET